jgi:sigma-B regulation protein RsbU (phosphoserine phosphatase)
MLFTNAGHPPPLVFHTGSLSIREPMERGLVLGVDADAEYPAAPAVSLGVGDIVALYTDGVLDAVNTAGECFGKERLMKALVANRALAAQEIADAVRAEVTAFCRDTSPADDLTLVLIKVL